MGNAGIRQEVGGGSKSRLLGETSSRAVGATTEKAPSSLAHTQRAAAGARTQRWASQSHRQSEQVHDIADIGN